MSTPQNDILDIIFEHKNRNYGAYVLRKKYDSTLSRAMLITASLIILFFGYGIASKYFSKFASEKKVTKKVEVDMMAPPPLDEKVVEPPPPKLPPEVKLDKFTPPKIVEDNEVKQEDEVKPVEEVTQVATKNQEGDTVVNFVPDQVTTAVEDNNVYEASAIEEPAEPPYDLTKYLNDHVEYPEANKEMGDQGRVKIRFIVDKDGSITSVEVYNKGKCAAGLEEEALKVAKLLPKWKPGKQNKKPVRMSFLLPITFTLD